MPSHREPPSPVQIAHTREDAADRNFDGLGAAANDTRTWAAEFTRRARWGTFTYDFASCNAATGYCVVLGKDQAPAVVGLRPGMAIVLTPPWSWPNGLTIDVAAGQDKIAIWIANVTAAPVNAGSGTFSFLAWEVG